MNGRCRNSSNAPSELWLRQADFELLRQFADLPPYPVFYWDYRADTKFTFGETLFAIDVDFFNSRRFLDRFNLRDMHLNDGTEERRVTNRCGIYRDKQSVLVIVTFFNGLAVE